MAGGRIGRAGFPILPAMAACGVMWAAPASADYQSTMDALTSGLPPDASALIYRIVDCNHWGGEEPYDAARKAAIEKAMRELNCNGLTRDEAALRRRYGTNPPVLKAIDMAKELVF